MFVKKYLIALCTVGSIYAAEPRHSSSLIELYCESNRNQENFFLACLETAGVSLTNKSVVSIGCNTGGIEYHLATSTFLQSMHAIDADEHIITFCQKKYQNLPKLSFLRSCPEDFRTRNVYDLALASSRFNEFQDKTKAIASIHGCLKKGGHFFAHIETSTNKESFMTQAYHDMIASVPFIGTLLKNISDPTNDSRLDYGELCIMLSQAGFEIKKADYKSYDCDMTADEWRKMLLPLFLSTPQAQYIITTISDNWFAQKSSQVAFGWIRMSPEEKQQHETPFFPEIKDELVEKIGKNDFLRYIFNKYLNFCFNHMQKNDDGTYTWTYETTVILTQKK